MTPEATVQSRLLARNGSVTLLSNTINTPVRAAGNNPHDIDIHYIHYIDDVDDIRAP